MHPASKNTVFSTVGGWHRYVRTNYRETHMISCFKEKALQMSRNFIKSKMKNDKINNEKKNSTHIELTKIIWLPFIIIFPTAAFAIGMVDTEPNSAWTYTGWACDPSTPGYQSEVQARRDDGKFLGRVIADLPQKAATPPVCSSPHGVHGFKLDIERKPEWADDKKHDVTLYSIDHKGKQTPFHTFSAQFSTSSDNVVPPKIPGDIVGRELDAPELGKIGHLGIWDGSQVIEVLNEGSGSKVFRKSWDDFKSRSKTWDTIHPKYPEHAIKSCWLQTCDINPDRSERRVSALQAVIYRANQVYMIGADYSYTVIFTTAEPAMVDYKDSRWKRRAIRGKYRSDVFIYDAFRASTDIDNAGIFPYRTAYNMSWSWREKVSSLYGIALTLPYKLREKISNF